MNKLIIANWKMNPRTTREAVRLARAEDSTGAVIAPPFPFLIPVKRGLRRAALGAQDVSFEQRGAYTGEVSPAMLRALGVRYVIVGHSERRARGETDAVVNKKVNAALAAGLTVVLCVGEAWSVRKKGLAAAKRFVAGQLRKDLRLTKSSKLKAKSLIIAYEPIWAIGTGKADTPAEASEMAKYIKEFSIFPVERDPDLRDNFQFSIKVLYGGSVTPRNARSFFQEDFIDGALVGGASLKINEFKKILAASPGAASPGR